MARSTLILAKNAREVGSYARLAGLARGTYRSVAKGAQIRGARSAEIHILPSFLKAPNRHSLLASLRYTRNEIFYVDPADFAEVVETRGDLTERQLEVAYRYNALLDLPDDEDPQPQWQQDLEAILEPEGWEPPDTLTAEQVLQLAASPEKTGAEILGIQDAINAENIPAEPEEKPVQRRRTRCADCGNLHFKDEACPSTATTSGMF